MLSRSNVTKVLLFSVCIFSFFCDLEAKHFYGTLSVDEVVRVHDGDTFTLNIDAIYPAHPYDGKTKPKWISK